MRTEIVEGRERERVNDGKRNNRQLARIWHVDITMEPVAALSDL